MIKLLAVTLLAAIVGKGAAYVSDDLKVPSPGPDWQLQEGVQNAPQLRGAFTLDHGKYSSLITFGLDKLPHEQDPANYLDNAFLSLTAPPLSMHVLKKDKLTLKGVPAVRADYTDSEGKRHFTQVVAKFPDGMFVMVIQAPDADTLHADVRDFDRALDGIVVGKRKR